MGARPGRAPGVPRRPFARRRGRARAPARAEFLADIERAGRAAATVVRTVAGHDTASAFAAAPLAGPTPRCSRPAPGRCSASSAPSPARAPPPQFNLTNERGIDGTIRLLRNVMGLWLMQECAAAGQPGRRPATTTSCLASAPRRGRTSRCLTPTTDRCCARGDMPCGSRAVRDARRAAARGPRQFVRSILVSLACKYRLVLERLRGRHRPPDRRPSTSSAAAAATSCFASSPPTSSAARSSPGPVEATAMGNVLVQARAAGELATLAEMRELVAALVRAARAMSPRPKPTPRSTSTNVSSPAPAGRDHRRSTDHRTSSQSAELATGNRSSRDARSALAIETPSWGYGGLGDPVRVCSRSQDARVTSSRSSPTPPRSTG